MNRRDKELGEALRGLEVPEHAPEFFERLEDEIEAARWEAQLDKVGETRAHRQGQDPRRQTSPGHPRGWFTWLPSRPLSGGLVGVALAAAVVLALMFAPRALVPDQLGGVATAAEIKAKMSAALQAVSGLRGILVVGSGETSGAGAGEMRWKFATNYRGDFRLSGENRLDSGVLRTEEVAYDAVAGVEKSWSREGDEGVFGGARSGLAAGPPDPGPSEWILERRLGAVVRALLASEAPAVKETSYQGREAWVLSTEVGPNLIADVSPDRLDITVDQQTGFPLKVVATAGGELVQEYRLEQLEIDPVFAAGYFSLSLPPELDVEPQDQGFRHLRFDEVQPAVGYAPLLPSWVPDGYSLSEVTVAGKGTPTGKEGMNPAAGGVVSVSFRRGFDKMTVSTRLVGELPDAWSDPLASGEGFIDKPERVILKDGAFAGSAAEVLIDPRSTPHIWTRNDSLVLTVAGDLSREELVRVTESMAGR